MSTVDDVDYNDDIGFEFQEYLDWNTRGRFDYNSHGRHVLHQLQCCIAWRGTLQHPVFLLVLGACTYFSEDAYRVLSKTYVDRSLL